jgi:hypothetical protein
VEYAHGEPEDPLSREEVLGKFRTLSYPVIGPACAQAIEEMVDRLDLIADMSGMQRLTFGVQ